MGEATAISWARATFNPWMGCAKVSPGCANCYAETLTKNRMGLDVWGDSPRKRTSEGNWKKPLAWNRDAEAEGQRRRVFCASLADVFEERPEVEPWRVELFELIWQTPWLDWLVLTKRPEFARDWLRATAAHAPNVWMGTSIENARHTWRADVLREIPDTIRFISAEPLLGSLFERRERAYPCRGCDNRAVCEASERCWKSALPLDLSGIDWLIVGGESGGRDSRPMHPLWARELRDAAAHAGVALHFKQWGSWAPYAGGGRDGVIVSPSGRVWTDGSLYHDHDEEEGGYWMRYCGAYPDSGGRLLDGQEHLDFPAPRAEVPSVTLF